MVTLTGVILDDRQRGAIRVAAENTPGVKSVEDQVAFVEPMSGMVIPPAAA
jgi:osmotically-inducible protein OsmY